MLNCVADPPVGPRAAVGRLGPTQTGPRHAAIVRASLAAVRAAGSPHHATVNDVLPTAVAGAIGRLLAERGESLDTLVVSVQVSGRTAAGGTPSLGNRVGVMPVAVPARGDRWQRLGTTAAITRAARTTSRGASAMLLVPAFRRSGCSAPCACSGRWSTASASSTPS